MWFYREYLKVDEDLIDVYSEEADRSRSRAWQGFIPHDDFRNLFERLLTALERGSTEQIKPPWIYGAYGTGKTFACFVIKHLFEEPIDIVKSYMDRHEKIKDLIPRFLALRNSRRWLVVYKSASSHITSTTILLSEIQDAIKRAFLESASELLMITFKEKVLSYLKEHPTLWEDIFQKHQLETFSAYEKPEDAILTMEGQGSEAQTLTEKVAQILEKDTQVILYSTPDDTKEWLKEVINKKELAGILFMWDEFTDFFYTNQSYSGLQELAHAARDIPFYLIPVTHLSPEILMRRAQVSDEKTIEKLFDRFYRVRFQLQPVTAYELAGNAIKVKETSEWEDKKISLWGRVELAARQFLRDEAREDHFKKLIPLHPYSAFLLSIISQGHSSSQRSLFKYLKGKERGAFPWFLDRYPGEQNKYWITPDLLWDYFFGDAKAEEISSKIRNVINFFESRAEQIHDEETLAIFKTIMLLNALYIETPDERLRPDRRNLQFAFYGVELEKDLESHINKLVTLGSVNRVPLRSDNEEYGIPLHNFDEKELKKIQEELERIHDFPSFATELRGVVRSFLEEVVIFRQRIKDATVSVGEFLKRREGVNPKLKPYEVGVVAIVPQTDSERVRAVEVCRRCAERSKNMVYILLNPPFGEENYKEWINNKAHSNYANKINDLKNEKHYESRAGDLLEDYKKRVRIEEQTLFFNNKERVFYVRDFGQILEKIVFTIFPYCPEKVTRGPETLYTGSSHKEPFDVGLGVKGKVTKQYEGLDRKLREVGSGKRKEKALCELKKKVKEKVEGKSGIPLIEIWEELQKPPIGLTPTPAGKVLFGFAMKEFCDGSYYWSDGTDCKPLNPERMRELLTQVVKGSRGAEQLEIRKLSPEIEKFCNALQTAFNIHSDEVLYPETLKNAARERVKELGYPIWALKYIPQTGESTRNWNLVIEIIEKFLRSEDPLDVGLNPDISSIVNKDKLDVLISGDVTHAGPEEIVFFLNILQEGLIDNLRDALKRKTLEQGFLTFLSQKASELYLLIKQEDHISLSTVMANIKNLLQEEVYLWDEKTVSAKLQEVYADLKLTISLSNLILRYDVSNLTELLDLMRERWLPENVKLNPLLTIEVVEDDEIKEALNSFLDVLHKREATSTDKLQLAELVARRHKELREIFLNSREILRHWIHTNLEYDLSETEVDEILRQVAPLVLDDDGRKVKQKIENTCQDFGRIKLLESLKTQWRKFANTDTPREWSEKYFIPINWVLEGTDYYQVLKLLDSCSQSNFELSEIEEALSFFEEHKDAFESLQDPSKHNKALLQRLLPKSADLLYDDCDFVDGLKRFLMEKSGNTPHEWPLNESRIAKLAEEYLRNHYVNIKDRITAQVTKISPERIKDVLSKLLEDPDIGLKIFKMLSG